MKHPEFFYICIMVERDWKRQIRREASAHGMCRENRDALESIESKKEAIALYKKTIDWALEEGYPSYETLSHHFSDCEDMGIYVNKYFNGEILNEHSVYVFHHCSGIVRTGLNVNKRIIPMMYFANGCDMKILPSGRNNLDVRVPLYVFGDNGVLSVPSESVTFKVYKFDVK